MNEEQQSELLMTKIRQATVLRNMEEVRRAFYDLECGHFELKLSIEIFEAGMTGKISKTEADRLLGLLKGK